MLNGVARSVASREWILIVTSVLTPVALGAAIAAARSHGSAIMIGEDTDVISSSLLPLVAAGLVSLVVCDDGVDGLLRLSPTVAPCVVRYFLPIAFAALLLCVAAFLLVEPISRDTVGLIMRNFGIGLVLPALFRIFSTGGFYATSGLLILVPAILPGQSSLREWLEFPFWSSELERDSLILGGCIIVSASLDVIRIRVLHR